MMLGSTAHQDRPWRGSPDSEDALLQPQYCLLAFRLVATAAGSSDQLLLQHKTTQASLQLLWRPGHRPRSVCGNCPRCRLQSHLQQVSASPEGVHTAAEPARFRLMQCYSLPLFNRGPKNHLPMNAFTSCRGCKAGFSCRQRYLNSDTTALYTTWQCFCTELSQCEQVKIKELCFEYQLQLHAQDRPCCVLKSLMLIQGQNSTRPWINQSSFLWRAL